ncbi:protein kinase domain-containing protein [Streptomyces abyssomicinicus]|uniref:serine/threonine-protein kinase n=1 Tax=Streptomyces abyssomicinicus TaxID=574929 RepID=UPI0012504086|nr:serine/threonine-protein kinase [Streptomyces abyssomicinicus]
MERVLADRYRLVRLLGQGGMGEVWEGRDEVLGRAVAVKVISVLAGGGSAADEARARFLREARITAALQHPHIVTVHDLGTATTAEGSTPFLVMELLRGEGLEAAVRRGPVGGADAARWGGQICEALAEAHAAGVMHRDIKPANLFVETSGRVKVLDFGIARAADPAAADGRLTRTGLLVGTAAYMAPEQARGHPEQASDLYAVGCVLFELRTGRLPFTAPDALGFLTAHLNDAPPAPSSVAPDVSPAWDRLILRLLAKDPRARYGSAGELADALRELDGPPAAAAPVPSPRPGGASTAPAPEAAPTVASTRRDTPAEAGRPALSRRGLLLGGAGFAVVATVGVAAGVHLTGAPGHDPFAWSHDLGSDRGGYDQPLRSGERCFVPAHDSAVVQAVSLTDGRRLWRRDLDLAWPLHGRSQAAVTDGGDTVVVLTERPAGDLVPMLHVLDGATGRTRWELESYDKDDYTLHVLDRAGLVLFGSDDPNQQHVTAFEARTGEERWSRTVSGPGPVTAIGDLALVGSTALDGTTGKKLWEQPRLHPYGDRHEGPTAPRRTGDDVLFHEQGANDRVDLVLRAVRTGREKWRLPLSAIRTVPGSDTLHQTPPAAPLSGTTLLLPRLPGERGGPTAVDVRTGREKWTFDGAAGSPDGGPDPVSTPDGFVLPTADGVVCLGAEDGTERWRSKGGEDLGIDSAGDYTVIHHSHTANLFQRVRTVRVLRARDGHVLWQGDFEATIRKSAPLAAGRTLAFLDPQETLRGIRLTG